MGVAHSLHSSQVLAGMRVAYITHLSQMPQQELLTEEAFGDQLVARASRGERVEVAAKVTNSNKPTNTQVLVSIMSATVR